MAGIESREEFLQQPHIAVLATVRPDGRPHAVPIWYLYEDGVFIMSTGRHSQKHRNVRANPEAMLVVDRRTLPYRAFMAEGRAEVGPPLTPEQRLRVASRYLGEEGGRRYAEDRGAVDSVTIRLRPRRFVEYPGQAERG